FLLEVRYVMDCTSVTFRAVFFFQAEDGIRDSSVTGVQTCALPIWVASTMTWSSLRLERVARSACRAWIPRSRMRAITSRGSSDRSEERRVGKECGCRWAGG